MFFLFFKFMLTHVIWKEYIWLSIGFFLLFLNGLFNEKFSYTIEIKERESSNKLWIVVKTETLAIKKLYNHWMIFEKNFSIFKIISLIISNKPKDEFSILKFFFFLILPIWLVRSISNSQPNNKVQFAWNLSNKEEFFL